MCKKSKMGGEKSYLFHKVNLNYRYRTEKKVKTTTYIFAARCSDGVAIISDRLESRGQKRDYVNKIERPSGLNVVFAAAGASTLFKDFIRELSRKVAINVGLKNDYIQKMESLDNDTKTNLKYNTHDFKIDCVNLLREFRALYESSTKEGMLLQVVFSIPDSVGTVNKPRLFYSDLIKCEPIPIENQCVAIGQPALAEEFKNKWDENMTMLDTVKLATFIIKYIEKSGLSKDEDGIDTVGIGDLMPQVYFFTDNTAEPKEINGEELKQMIIGVDEELEKAMKFDKKRAMYLEEFPTLWASK